MKNAKLKEKRSRLAMLCCFVLATGMALALMGCAEKPEETVYMQIRTYNLWNPAEAPEEPGIIDVPVINEQGKELYVIVLQKPENYEEECYKRFEEKHGFDANIFMDDDLWMTEIVPTLSEVTEHGNIVEYEKVMQVRNQYSLSWEAIGNSIYREAYIAFVAACMESENDVVACESHGPMTLYADAEDLERIRNYPTVEVVRHWERQMSGIQANH